MTDEPAFLTVGTEVSAKYKGAFCEAKIKNIVKLVKCKVVFKDHSGCAVVSDIDIDGELKLGAAVGARRSSNLSFSEAVVSKVTDCSTYTVYFNDGDESTLRRSQLCLKGDRHFVRSETLDQLPLTHPEHFGTPVMKSGKLNKRHSDGEDSDSSSDGEQNVCDEASSVDAAKVSYGGRLNEIIGQVVCIEHEERKKSIWVPALVVQPTASGLPLKARSHIIVKSFRDNKFYTVLYKKETKAFTKDMANKNDEKLLKAAFLRASEYFERKVLPSNWDRSALLEAGADDEALESTDDEHPDEERDHVIAQLYKFLDENGTPLNKAPIIGHKEMNMYRFFSMVRVAGGYNKVCNQSKWQSIYSKMRLPNTPNGPMQLKNMYKKYLLGFEEFYKKLGSTMGTYLSPPKPSKICKRLEENRAKSKSLAAESCSKLKTQETDHKMAEHLSKIDDSADSRHKGELAKAKPECVKLLKGKTENPSSLDGSDNKRTTRGAVETEEKRITTSRDIRKDKVSTANVIKNRHETSGSKTSKTDSRKMFSKTETCWSSAGERSKRIIHKNDKVVYPGLSGTLKKLRGSSSETSTGSPSIDNSSEDGSLRNEEISSCKSIVRGRGKKCEVDVGSKLEVKYGNGGHNKIYAAKVVEIGCEKYKVHYAGWNNRYDEWITRERIINVAPPVPEPPKPCSSSKHVKAALPNLMNKKMPLNEKRSVQGKTTSVSSVAKTLDKAAVTFPIEKRLRRRSISLSEVNSKECARKDEKKEESKECAKKDEKKEESKECAKKDEKKEESKECAKKDEKKEESKECGKSKKDDWKEKKDDGKEKKGEGKEKKGEGKEKKGEGKEKKDDGKEKKDDGKEKKDVGKEKRDSLSSRPLNRRRSNVDLLSNQSNCEPRRPSSLDLPIDRDNDVEDEDGLGQAPMLDAYPKTVPSAKDGRLHCESPASNVGEGLKRDRKSLKDEKPPVLSPLILTTPFKERETEDDVLLSPTATKRLRRDGVADERKSTPDKRSERKGKRKDLEDTSEATSITKSGRKRLKRRREVSDNEIMDKLEQGEQSLTNLKEASLEGKVKKEVESVPEFKPIEIKEEVNDENNEEVVISEPKKTTEKKVTRRSVAVALSKSFQAEEKIETLSKGNEDATNDVATEPMKLDSPLQTIVEPDIAEHGIDEEDGNETDVAEMDKTESEFSEKLTDCNAEVDESFFSEQLKAGMCEEIQRETILEDIAAEQTVNSGSNEEEKLTTLEESDSSDFVLKVQSFVDKEKLLEPEIAESIADTENSIKDELVDKSSNNSNGYDGSRESGADLSPSDKLAEMDDNSTMNSVSIGAYSSEEKSLNSETSSIKLEDNTPPFSPQNSPRSSIERDLSIDKKESPKSSSAGVTVEYKDDFQLSGPSIRKKSMKDGGSIKKKRRSLKKHSGCLNCTVSDNDDADSSLAEGNSSETSPGKPNSCSHLHKEHLQNRPSKFNFDLNEMNLADGEKKIEFLMEKINEIKKLYMDLKSEVACIDRRRKRARRRERDNIAGAASACS